MGKKDKEKEQKKRKEEEEQEQDESGTSPVGKVCRRSAPPPDSVPRGKSNSEAGPVVRKNCVRERIRVNATLLHCDLLTGRGREGKLADTTIDGEYNLSGQELPLSIMRLYLPPHGQIRQCCSETQNRDYLL